MSRIGPKAALLNLLQWRWFFVTFDFYW